MRHSTCFVLALLLGCGLAQAGTPIDRSHPLDVDGRVSISNVSGEVTVTGWDRPEVRITGTLGDGAEPLKIEGDNHQLKIKVEAEGSEGWFNWGKDSRMKPTTLKIFLPLSANVEVNVVSANARLNNLEGGEIDIDSVSGQVGISADSPEISVDSVSGKVTLSGKATRLSIDTVSGDVDAPVVGEHGKLESVSGDITVRGGPFERMNASTVSGDLDVRGSMASGGKMKIETMSGDVNVYLPDSTSAKVSASTFSGDIDSNLGQTKSTSSHGPGNELSARIGDGEGTISLQSFSGDIRIQLSPTGTPL